VRAGEFEIAGQSQIRWLHPRFVETQWLPREGLRFGTVRDHATYCFLPRRLTRQWLAAHGYPWPAHFEPATSRAAEQTIKPQQAAFVKWFRSKYPKGTAASIKTLAGEYYDDRRLRVGESTIRRALGRKK
jgi:hypothetical protein